MKNLPNIEIPKRDLSLMLEHPKSAGGEAVICRGYDDKTLYKLFLDPVAAEEAYTFDISDLIHMSDNKLKKLLALRKKNPNNCVMPLSTISMNKEVIGYEMTYDPNDVVFTSPNSFETWADVVHILENSSIALREFQSKDIIFGDVARRNILVNKKTGKITFCDVDNVCVAGHTFDVLNEDMEFYVNHCGINDKMDAYMHNILTFETVGLTTEECVYEPTVIEEFFDTRALPIAKTLDCPERFSGEYAIQYIKRRK